MKYNQAMSKVAEILRQYKNAGVANIYKDFSSKIKKTTGQKV